MADPHELRPQAKPPAPRIVRRASVRVRCAVPGASKLLPGIRATVQACGLKDGATISFHHHLRNGDAVLNQVVAEIAAMGLRDITIAATSLFPVHVPLVHHMRSGVVTGISATYIAGPVGEALSRGALARPARMYTHGGRACAIEAGELHIDTAFVAAPTADTYGNLNGTEGKAAFGTMGYPMVDVQYADTVVALTDCRRHDHVGPTAGSACKGGRPGRRLHAKQCGPAEIRRWPGRTVFPLAMRRLSLRIETNSTDEAPSLALAATRSSP